MLTVLDPRAPVKYASVAALVAAAGLWSHFAAFPLAVPLAVATGVMLVMAQAFRARLAVTYIRSTVSGSAVAVFLISAALPGAALAADLSKYRNFELGTDLSSVARQVSVNVSQAKVIHARPALIQELTWSPRPLGSDAQTEPAKEVVFHFYDGKLFRIVIDYDRYETEGLTANDFVDALSATYGPAVKPPAAALLASATYSEPQEVIAQWQDSQYRFELIRLSYGPTYRLVGTMQSLEAPARAASLESKRLDDQEAPTREAARIASEDLALKARLEKARLVNKPKFRP